MQNSAEQLTKDQVGKMEIKHKKITTLEFNGGNENYTHGKKAERKQ